jgi:hypothetical protein
MISATRVRARKEKEKAMGGRCIECGAKCGNSDKCSPCATRDERVAIAAWLRSLPAMQHPQALADAICRQEHHATLAIMVKLAREAT